MVEIKHGKVEESKEDNFGEMEGTYWKILTQNRIKYQYVWYLAWRGFRCHMLTLT